MRVRRKIIIAAIIAIAVLFVFGAIQGWNPMAGIKAKNDLKEKYGETFRVIEMKGVDLNGVRISGHQMVCAPARDDTLRFWVGTAGDGEVLVDKYVQVLLGKQIDERVEPYIKRIATDYAINSFVMYFSYKDDEWEKYASLDNYISDPDIPKSVNTTFTDIVIDESSLTGLSFSDEYEAFKELFEKDMPRDITVFLYFTDDKRLKEAQTIFDKNESEKRDASHLMEGGHSFIFEVESSKILISKEEYEELRILHTDGTTPITGF